MNKTKSLIILLCASIFLILPGCMKFKSITFVEDSEELKVTEDNTSKSGQADKDVPKVKINQKEIKTLFDFDNYVMELRRNSDESYGKVLDSAIYTENELNKQIAFQKQILKQIDDLIVPEAIFKSYYSKGKDAATKYVKLYFKDLVKFRIELFQDIIDDNDNSTTLTQEKIKRYKTVVIPLSEKRVKDAREEYMIEEGYEYNTITDKFNSIKPTQGE